MTQDALLTAIEVDAVALGKRIVAEAEEAAEELIRKAKDDVAAAKKRRLNEIRLDVEREKAAAINRARTEGRVEVLKARQEAVDNAIDTAVRRLGSSAGPERARLVKGLFFETKARWEGISGGAAPVVSVNPADLEIVKGDGVELKGDESIGLGVVFASVDGRFRFENTLASRRKRSARSLNTLIHGVLFG